MLQNNSSNLSQSNLQNNDNLVASNPTIGKHSKVKYASMLKSEEQIKKKQDYFNLLLNRHPQKLQQVNQFFKNKAEQFNNQILVGKYDIKAREWSAEQGLNKAIDKKKSLQVMHLKKNLQNQLKNIENQIDDEEKKSRVISEQQHINFMKKMENERKELLRKKQQAAKLQQEQRLLQEKQLKEQKEQIQIQKKNKRRKEIQQTMKILEEEHKKRLEISKQQELILKEKMKEKTTADKIQEQYYQKQNQSLEQKKKKLAEIRTLHRPINKKQLDEFAQKYQNLKKQKITDRSNSLQKPVNKSQQKFYKSVFYKKIEKQSRLFEDSKNQEQLSKLKEAKDKLKKFSQHVKTSYKPTIDEKLVEEMKFRSVNLSKRGRSTSHTVTETPNKIGLRYLEFSKLQIDHQKLLVSGDQPEPEQQKQQQLDYLAELRKKNKRKEINSAQDLLEQMQKMNLSKDERQQKVLDFTEKLQKKAKKREEMDKRGKNGVDDQLDALYLEAIQAKLSLLDDI